MTNFWSRAARAVCAYSRFPSFRLSLHAAVVVAAKGGAVVGETPKPGDGS